MSISRCEKVKEAVSSHGDCKKGFGDKLRGATISLLFFIKAFQPKYFS